MSKKQSIISRSNVESEFRPIAQGICKFLWIKFIFKDIKMKWEEPIKIYCQDKSTISIDHNQVQHDFTKHVAIDIS